ncbi:phosphoribosyltransferase family protein [Desulforhopalus sp. 52FAK]
MDILNGLESGEKFNLSVDGLDYDIELPYVRINSGEKKLKIASLNLVGQTRFNQDLGILLAEKIRENSNDLSKVAILTVVEKALQITQVTAQELNIDAVAVAYNRVKPHMEPDNRPVIQIGSDSITSGSKFLAIYERDMGILAQAESVILIDDVVSTGGTFLGLMDLLEEVARQNQTRPIEVSGMYCVAVEGDKAPILSAPVYSLANLPAPVVE